MTGDLFEQAVNCFDGDPAGDRVPRSTMARKVAVFFKARPGQWIDGRELMSIAGSYGWRTRISDCRRHPYNMRIENRQRRIGPYVVSEYQYLPQDSAQLIGAA